MSCIYSASLSALLAMPAERPVESVEDLAIKKIKFGAVQGGSTIAFLRQQITLIFSILGDSWINTLI